jgi:hypothetical protein
MVVSAAPAAGQWCVGRPGSPAWVAGFEGGGVEYDLGSGVRGIEWGPELAHIRSRVAIAVGYRRVELVDLTEAQVTPHFGRGSLSVRMGSIGGVAVCATAHGGGSRFEAAGDDGTVMVGGLGLALAGRTIFDETPLHPFVEVRGLAARSTAEVLGVAIDEAGYSVGVEAGITAYLGRAAVRLTGSLDGFAPGLGLTPYASRAIRLGIGFHL